MSGIPEIPTASSSELNKTFGVLMIGFIFAVTLYGLTFFRECAGNCSENISGVTSGADG